jgi:hypothetical protein
MKSNTFLRPYGLVFDGPQFGMDKVTLQTVAKDIDDSLEVSWRPAYTIIMNNYFKEYTAVMLYKDDEDNTYHVSYFIDYPEKDIRHLRILLKKYGTKIDNYDIDNTLITVKNKEAAIYNYIMKYLEENNVVLK